MGISKRSKRDPLVNAIRKEKRIAFVINFVIYLGYFHHIDRLYCTIKEVSVSTPGRKKFFQTHTP